MASDFNMAGIKAFFQVGSNHTCSGGKYAFTMTYQERLEKAMGLAKVDRAALAKYLGISVQAVGQVVRGDTKAFDAANHIKASIRLACDPLWLATGKRQHNFVAAPEPPWPFPGIDRKRFDDLRDDEKIEIQGIVRDRIERFEAARPVAPETPAPAPRKRA